MTPEWKKKQEELRLPGLPDMFGVDKPIIGMVHLPPLPGSPNYDGRGLDPVIEWALRDVDTYQRAGVDGLIVENMWDHPYFVGEDVPPEAMTAQAVAAREVVKAANVPTGINVIHNGGRVTLSIALAAGATFVRICILTGARLWDTGELDHGLRVAIAPSSEEPTGRAHQDLRGRRQETLPAVSGIGSGDPHRVDRFLLSRRPHRFRANDRRRPFAREGSKDQRALPRPPPSHGIRDVGREHRRLPALCRRCHRWNQYQGRWPGRKPR